MTVQPNHHALVDITNWHPDDTTAVHCWAATRSDYIPAIELHIACRRCTINAATNQIQICACVCHYAWRLAKYRQRDH